MIIYSPLVVPDFVYKVNVPKSSTGEVIKHPIKDISDEDLYRLCDEFRENLLKKKYGQH